MNLGSYKRKGGVNTTTSIAERPAMPQLNTGKNEMTTKELYAVGCVHKSAQLNNGMTIPFSGFADGCVGMIPVFENKDIATKWAEGDQVITLKVGKLEGDK